MESLARLRQNLSFQRIGIVYVWIVVIVVFAILKSNPFFTIGTVRAVLNDYSLAGLAAMAVLIPMASGTIDASIGGNISLTSVVAAELLGSTHLPIAIVVVLTLAVGAAIGLVNVVVVVVLKIPSIIGTLAVWLIADALSVAVSGNQIVSSTKLSGTFGSDFALSNWNEFEIPIFFLIILATIIGVVLTQTPGGRNTTAVGLNLEVARNTGIHVRAVQARALIIGGMLGALAGLVLTAQVASASPGSGDGYLLPAFAAVFLGATQFRLKRFSAWGTVLAVFMLGTGQYGLQLSGAPQWTPNIFQGLALIAAIGLSQILVTKSPTRRGNVRKFFSMRKEPVLVEQTAETNVSITS
jgi:ribose transport system permease protein